MWLNAGDYPPNEPYEEWEKDIQKRLRVLGGWLLDEVVDAINLTNYDFQVYVFLKLCDNLAKKYPIHDERNIPQIRKEFWARAQQKRKNLIHQKNRFNKTKRRLQILKQLVAMRFLPL